MAWGEGWTAWRRGAEGGLAVETYWRSVVARSFRKHTKKELEAKDIDLESRLRKIKGRQWKPPEQNANLICVKGEKEQRSAGISSLRPQ